jgi:hypothetical protein
LAMHARMIHGYSSGRPFDAMEKRIYTAAARDPKVAQRMGRVGVRIDSPLKVMRPGTLARVAWASRRPRGYSSTTRTSPSLTA